MNALIKLLIFPAQISIVIGTYFLEIQDVDNTVHESWRQYSR